MKKHKYNQDIWDVGGDASQQEDLKTKGKLELCPNSNKLHIRVSTDGLANNMFALKHQGGQKQETIMGLIFDKNSQHILTIGSSSGGIPYRGVLQEVIQNHREELTKIIPDVKRIVLSAWHHGVVFQGEFIAHALFDSEPEGNFLFDEHVTPTGYPIAEYFSIPQDLFAFDKPIDFITIACHGEYLHHSLFAQTFPIGSTICTFSQKNTTTNGVDLVKAGDNTTIYSSKFNITHNPDNNESILDEVMMFTGTRQQCSRNHCIISKVTEQRELEPIMDKDSLLKFYNELDIRDLQNTKYIQMLESLGVDKECISHIKSSATSFKNSLSNNDNADDDNCYTLQAIEYFTKHGCDYANRIIIGDMPLIAEE